MSFIEWVDLLNDIAWYYMPLYLLGATILFIWIITSLTAVIWGINIIFHIAKIMLITFFGDIKDLENKEIWYMYKRYQNVSNGKKPFKDFKNYIISLDYTEIEKLDKEEIK